MIANIGHETVEEVYALVPSLKVSLFGYFKTVILNLPTSNCCDIHILCVSRLTSHLTKVQSLRLMLLLLT
jgi:hypothetical protein